MTSTTVSALPLQKAIAASRKGHIEVICYNAFVEVRMQISAK